jgi:hypothetical protein
MIWNIPIIANLGYGSVWMERVKNSKHFMNIPLESLRPLVRRNIHKQLDVLNPCPGLISF